MRMLNASLSLIGAACLISGCTHAQGNETRPARPVRVQAVGRAPEQSGTRYSASIEPFEQVPLAFKASGYVDDLLRRTGADGRLRVAQAGDTVAKGTVLAKVREADYRERVEQARAQQSEAQASLTKTRLDLERAETLFAADSLTKTDLDSARAASDAAQARVAAAKSQIEVSLIALHDCELVCPTNGVLLERKIEVGTLVAPGSVGFVLGDISSVKARFGIPDSVVQSVKLGDAIGVTVEAVSPTAQSGRITAVAPTADPHSRVFDVEVTIPNKDGRLRPGMIGTVAVGRSVSSSNGATSQPLTLPLNAVVRSAADAHHYAVFVVERQADGDVARARAVELGEVTGNGVAVVKGVSLGDRVITSGATLLTDGDPVRIIP